jgi:hypothetical protein
MANESRYIPRSGTFDRALIDKLQVNSELKEVLIQLYQFTNIMADAINRKVSGDHPLVECLSGKLWSPDPTLSSTSQQTPHKRQSSLIVVDCGALPNTTTKTVAHGITCTSTTRFVNYWGAASDTTALTYIKLPYVSATAANIVEVSIDSTNINITTGADRTNYNTSLIVLEYLKY